MKQVTHTQALLRKRKMLLVLPLLALPFITLGFWALGGGKTAQEASSADKGGLNLQLPYSQVSGDSAMNKLSFYEKAQSDSQKRADWRRSDPFYRDVDTTISWNRVSRFEPSAVPISGHSGYDPTALNPSPYDGTATSSEEKVMQKLAELNEAIQNPEHPVSVSEQAMTGNTSQERREFKLGGDLERLEAMMQSAGSKADDDPELTQLSGMMDKILGAPVRL